MCQTERYIMELISFKRHLVVVSLLNLAGILLYIVAYTGHVRVAIVMGPIWLFLSVFIAEPPVRRPEKFPRRRRLFVAVYALMTSPMSIAAILSIIGHGSVLYMNPILASICSLLLVPPLAFVGVTGCQEYIRSRRLDMEFINRQRAYAELS